MYLNKDSFIVNNINLGRYITDLEISYNDTWAEDSGYSLSNVFTGTFKGTIPKFTVKFAKTLSTSDINYLTNNIFRKPIQTVRYDDADGRTKTIDTHKGDLALAFNGIEKHKAFSYDFVGNRPI